MKSIQLQTGGGLLEQLIALLIFSIGLLGLMGMQAFAVNQSSAAKYRAEASLLANQLIGIMWTDRTNLSNYQHNPTGPSCLPTGTDTTDPNALAWLTSFTNTSNPGYLPGATNAAQQIVVATDRTVNITVCWRSPQDQSWHNYTVTTQIPV